MLEAKSCLKRRDAPPQLATGTCVRLCSKLGGRGVEGANGGERHTQHELAAGAHVHDPMMSAGGRQGGDTKEPAQHAEMQIAAGACMLRCCQHKP